MKKTLSAILACVLFIALASSTLALSAPTTGVSIYFDGQKIRTEPDEYLVSNKIPDRFYMDVQPEIKSGTTFVPIRAIANYFDCYLGWQDPNVILNLEETTIILTIGSNTVLRNGSTSTLEASPYIKNGRTMVPLRFISETFGYGVDYINGSVYINTQPMFIDGENVISAQFWSPSIMGGVLEECKTNISITKLYQFIQNNSYKETEEPDFYSRYANFDYYNFYWQWCGISFMKTEGLGGDAVQQYEVYNRINDDSELIANIPDQYANLLGTDLGSFLIRDVSNDKWYQLSVDDSFGWWYLIKSIGGWEVILDNRV